MRAVMPNMYQQEYDSKGGIEDGGEGREGGEAEVEGVERFERVQNTRKSIDKQIS